VSETKVNRAPRWCGVLFAAFSSIFLIGGWWCAIVQDYRLRHDQPVQATVSRLEVIEYRGKSDSMSRELRFHYQYKVGGTVYESTEVFPTYMGGQVENELRDELFASLHEHCTTAAWYVDDEPSRAYLIHERSFGPYSMILFADLFFLAGLVVALPPADLAEPGVHVAESNRRRTITLVWLMPGVTAIGHYLLEWPTHWRGDFVIVTSVWTMISLGLMAWWRAAAGRSLLPLNESQDSLRS
jgi:hypothetical protein